LKNAPGEVDADVSPISSPWLDIAVDSADKVYVNRTDWLERLYEQHAGALHTIGGGADASAAKLVIVIQYASFTSVPRWAVGSHPENGPTAGDSSRNNLGDSVVNVTAANGTQAVVRRI